MSYKGMDQIFQKRLTVFQKTLEDSSAFFTKNSADILYLSSCTGSNNFLLVLKNITYLFTDGRYFEQVQSQTKIPLIFEKIKDKQDLVKKFQTILQDNKINTLRIKDAEIPYFFGLSLFTLENLFLKKDTILDTQRAYKDPFEIEIIIQNLLITKAAFLYIHQFIKPGMTEREIAFELEYYLKKQGAESLSFEPIIASGNRSSMPHGIASDKIIENGDLIQLDFGIIKEHYCSDFSRVLIVGEQSINPKLKSIHDIVLNALKKVQSEAQCGMLAKDIDLIAREYITAKGYKDYFVHGLGHGIGLEIHEFPKLNSLSEDIIENNMVITIEPGIYIPGLGGIRIEDVVLMTKNGLKVLTDCGYDYD